MGLFVYNGSSWSGQATGFKLYNGSSWTNVVRGYVYNGSSWSQFYPEYPANTSSPTITFSNSSPYNNAYAGGAGQTLTCSSGAWTNSGTITYQWEQKFWNGGSWGAVSGSTSSSIFVDSAKVGYSLRCTVTNTNNRGGTSVTTGETGTFPPAYLTGLTASKQGQNKALLSWNSSYGAGAYLIQYQYVGTVPLTNVYTTSTSYLIDLTSYPNIPSLGPSVTPAGPNSNGFPNSSGWGGYPGYGQNANIFWP